MEEAKSLEMLHSMLSTSTEMLQTLHHMQKICGNYAAKSVPEIVTMVLSDWAIEELFLINQVGTVDAYFRRFQSLRSLAQSKFSEEFYTNLFINGLQLQVRNFVQSFLPCNVIDAYDLACICEFERKPKFKAANHDSVQLGPDMAPSISIDISTSVNHIAAPPSSNFDFVVAALAPPVNEVWHGSIPILDTSLPVVGILLPELQKPLTNSAEDDKLSSFHMSILHSMELKDILCPLGADTKITVTNSNCLAYEGEPKEFADSFLSVDLLCLGSSGLDEVPEGGPSTYTALPTVAPLVNKFREHFLFNDPCLFSTTLTSVSSIEKMGNVMDICEEASMGSSTLELLMSTIIDDALVLLDSAIFQVLNHLGLGLTTRQGMSSIAHDRYGAELMLYGIELGKVTEFLELVLARSARLHGVLIDRLVRQFPWSS